MIKTEKRMRVFRLILARSYPRSLKARDRGTLIVLNERREKQMQVLRLVRHGGLAEDDRVFLVRMQGARLSALDIFPEGVG
jgi:hypothetical protein